MANLGSTTYTATTWTAGDIITEAKLDNMVANDQAYDSHTAQGLLLDNGKAYCGKDSGGTARDLIRLNSSNLLEVNAWDGWLQLPTANVPAYSSATVITNPSGIDWTTYLQVGDRVKFTQTTVKYFVVTAVTSTNLTLSGGTDYTVANAAISAFYYAKTATAQGFPQFFSFTPTLTNASLGDGTLTAKFSVVGKTCVARYALTFGSTTSVSGVIGFSLPVTAAGADFSYSARLFDASANSYQGVAYLATTSRADIYGLNTAGTYLAWAASSSTVPFTWTTSDIIIFVLIYEIA